MPSAFGVPTRTVNRYVAPETERLLTTFRVTSRANLVGATSLIYSGMSPSLYSAYRFDWQGTRPSDSNNAFIMQTSTDGGATYGALWTSSWHGYDSSNAQRVGTAAAQNYLYLHSNLNLTLDEIGTSGSLTFSYGLPNFSGTISRSMARWNAGSLSNYWAVTAGAGYYADTASYVNTVRFMMSTDKIKECALSVYGIVGYNLGVNPGVTA